VIAWAGLFGLRAYAFGAQAHRLVEPVGAVALVAGVTGILGIIVPSYANSGGYWPKLMLLTRSHRMRSGAAVIRRMGGMGRFVLTVFTCP
jgi:hypothetical protein